MCRVAMLSRTKSKEGKAYRNYDQVDMDQMSLFDTVSDSDVLKELQELEVSTMTPLDALNTLYRSTE